MLDQFIRAKKSRYIFGLSDIIAVQDLDGRVYDLHFTGPFGLEAGHADLLAFHELLIVFLGAGRIVDEERTVFILGVQSRFIFPPGLLRLYIGLHDHFRIQFCCDIFFIAHHSGGLFRKGCHSHGAGGQGCCKYDCQCLFHFVSPLCVNRMINTLHCIIIICLCGDFNPKPLPQAFLLLRVFSSRNQAPISTHTTHSPIRRPLENAGIGPSSFLPPERPPPSF